MASNKPYYTYLDYIFDYMVKFGCRTGQGGYILRGRNNRARKAGFNQEQIKLMAFVKI